MSSMNLWERFLLAGSVMIGGRKAYEFTNTWDVGQPAYPAANFENNVRAGYRKNELIYSCIAKKADSASLPVLRAYSKRTDKEIPEHPVRALIARPNPYMTEFDLWSLTMMMLDLAGRCYWEKQRSKAGKVVGLWPLRPDWVYPIRSGTGLPGGYEYHTGGQVVPLLGTDVLEFKLWDPLDLYGGLAPVSVACRVGDVDNAATDFLAKFFTSGGIPPGILSSKLKLNDNAVGDIRRRWKERYGGWQNWTEPAVLDSDASYQQTGLSFKDMGFDVLDARSEARICMLLRMPPILVGAKVGLDRATYANYGEAKSAWWQDDLMPQYRRLGDETNNDLASEFGSDVELRWDFSQVAALQEDVGKVWTRGVEALKARGITVNEFREMIGLPAIAGGEKLPAAPVPVIAPPKEAPEKEPPENEDAEPGKKALSRKADSPDDDDERRRAEAALMADMESYFTRQKGRILEAAGGDAS